MQLISLAISLINGYGINNEFLSLEPTSPLMPMAGPLFLAIKKMTNDTTDLNEVPLPDNTTNIAKQKPQKAKEEPKKKGGFWSNIFGGKK